MTLDNLIFALTDIRNQWPDSGKIPVVMEPSTWEDARHRDGVIVDMVLPCSESGGPETDTTTPLVSVQLSRWEG